MNSETQKVIDAVSAASGILIRDIMGRSRDPQITRARQAAMYLSVHAAGNSLKLTSKWFDRDHSTVGDNIKAVERDLSVSGPRAAIVDAARALLARGDKIEPATPQKAVKPFHGAMPRVVKRVTAAGWMEADGSLVVAP